MTSTSSIMTSKHSFQSTWVMKLNFAVQSETISRHLFSQNHWKSKLLSKNCDPLMQQKLWQQNKGSLFELSTLHVNTTFAMVRSWQNLGRQLKYQTSGLHSSASSLASRSRNFFMLITLVFTTNQLRGGRRILSNPTR